jgi:hypothetical protein
MAAERRIFRETAGSVAEAIMIRDALNTAETTEYFNVASGKVLRLTDFRFTTQLTGSDTVFRLRGSGQTIATAEEVARWVMADSGTYAQDQRTPLRLDGGDNGTDWILTVEMPGASPVAVASAAVIGHQD